MKKRFPSLFMAINFPSWLLESNLKMTIVLCFLSTFAFAQNGEGLVTVTCGHTPGSTEVDALIAYKMQTDGEMKAIYGKNTTFENLGSVYGQTMDREGNLYVAAGGVYAPGSNMNFRTHGNNTSPTMIYKIDGASIQHGENWKIADLVLAGEYEAGNNLIPNPPMCGIRRAGLGNICYNEKSNSLYTSNLADGKIYQLDTDGKVLRVFDPNFDGKSYDEYYGYAPLGQRTWAVAVRYPDTDDEDQKLYLYYSRWSVDANLISHGINNEIWAVELDAQTGAFLTETESKIMTEETQKTFVYPISDIEFDEESNRMLLSERRTKPHHSYLSSEQTEGEALELMIDNKSWKANTEVEMSSNHLAYMQSSKATTSSPAVSEIVDMDYEIDNPVKSMIGDVDIHKTWKQTETLRPEITVFPNPTAGVVQIKNGEENATYIITNTNGQIIRRGVMISDMESIDLSAMSNGVYWIAVTVDDKVYNQKINKTSR